MAVTKDVIPQRSRRLVCTSGDTRFWVTPPNHPALLTQLEVDASSLSGQFGVITLDIRDSYLPSGGSSTTVVRASKAVKAGECVSFVLDGEAIVFGGVDVRCNFPNAVVTLSAAFK